MSSKPWIGSPTFLLVMICLIVLPEVANQWSLSGDLESSIGPYLPEETLIHPSTGAMVVASVNDVPIYDVEIERYLERLNVFDEMPDTALHVYRSTVMSQLVRRQVILSYLQTTDFRASEQDINLALAEVKQSLAARGQSLDEFLASGKVDQAMLRRNLAWKIAWTRYLKSYLTEANLRRYFERNYERFDGTSRHVSQVYFGNPENLEDFDWDVAFREAVFLRDRIQQGEISFEDAVKKHSQAPSAADGGDMGWIKHHGPLDPRIHEAAFARPVGELVGPIQTKFGIHLMKVHQEKRGETNWKDMIDDIRTAAAAYLFAHVADRHISDSNVYYFGEEEGSEIDPSYVRRFSDEFIAP
ncbi:peptidylprolyl isomerase [Bremerella alba]|uniref:Chaperone SurA n=1 Tax=Bremerella alba TaxID=980252 RepID=A0A7V8V1Z4_9BACT|nr:peptidylprolyl isomerase [Bremerella alba]MBA2113434.1 Chaperone SurA [Bremerella alba]